MRITAVVIVALLVACGSSSAATTKQQARACLSTKAEVNVTKAGVMYARFASGNQVGLRWSPDERSAAAGLKIARVFAAQFHTVVGRLGLVGYTWDHKPSAAQSRLVASCFSTSRGTGPPPGGGAPITGGTVTPVKP